MLVEIVGDNVVGCVVGIISVVGGNVVGCVVGIISVVGGNVVGCVVGGNVVGCVVGIISVVGGNVVCCVVGGNVVGCIVGIISVVGSVTGDRVVVFTTVLFAVLFNTAVVFEVNCTFWRIGCNWFDKLASLNRWNIFANVFICDELPND
jgi:hypothetical protein